MEIKEYVTNILYISIFAIILELFLPKTKLKKYISSIISLLVILTIINPLFNIFTDENIESALDNAIFALSNNANITASTNSFDFSNYKNKVIVSRVKTNLEQEMLKVFTENLKNIAVIKNVEVSLDNSYKISEVKVYIEGSNLNTVKIVLDKIIAEYNVPNSMLKIIDKGV